MGMILSSVLLVSFLCIAYGELKPEDQYGDSCPTLLNATAALNTASHTFIYRCRHGDDCGGVGDRFAGVMGAAFFAAVSGRSFRIHWPGIEHVFQPGHANWTFDPVVLGIPYKDHNGHELDKTRNHIVIGRGHIQPALPGITDVVMYNDLNGRAINDRSKWDSLKKYKHIYFHSNRSPDLSMHTVMTSTLAASGVTGGTTLQPSHEGLINAYRCMFNDIFQPTEEFLNSTYKAIEHEPVPFREITNIVNHVGERSLAFHYRIEDKHVAKDSVEARIDDTTIHWLASLGVKHRVGENQLNLFFISNSPASAAKVLHDGSIKAAFKHVYCQELTGSRHTNSEGAVIDQVHTVHADSAIALSFQQAMRDWWIMRIADILVCGYSGFCISAGVAASEKQVKYDLLLKQIEKPKAALCTNRDCVR